VFIVKTKTACFSAVLARPCHGRLQPHADNVLPELRGAFRRRLGDRFSHCGSYQIDHNRRRSDNRCLRAGEATHGFRDAIGHGYATRADVSHASAVLHLAAGAAALAAPRLASAQSYPTRPVRVVTGAPAGLAPDIVARLTAQRLSERLNQQFVVDNRPGAGTNIAAEAVIRSAPDGYTLFLATPANAINAALYPSLNFNFMRDTAPIAGICLGPYVMVVNPMLPTTTIPDFIAYAKANPGKINMASAGNGTPPHVFGELFKMMVGVDLVHVPYRSNCWADRYKCRSAPYRPRSS
jgi:Tripartite tricarboxylate transporter family receptor